MTRVRFAPSPTGRLHAGNLRTAVLNWLYARKAGGEYILRIDDTDRERSTQAFVDFIKRDLAWLSLDWDKVFYQSDHMDDYRTVLDALKADGRVYPCYETRTELDLKRKQQLQQGHPPVYDREALRLTEEQRQKYIDAGRTPHWRFMLEHRRVAFEDGIKGHVEIDCASISDPVLVREDGQFLYTLCSVIDDIRTEITDIIRGDDHVTNTGVQIQIFEALKHKPPQFLHHSLLTSGAGVALSKRDGVMSIDDMRVAGIEPIALLSLMASLGGGKKPGIFDTPDEFIKDFNPGRLSTGPVCFSLEVLKNISEKVLHALSFSVVKKRFDTFDLGGLDAEALWLAIRNNISEFQEISDWVDILNGYVAPLANPEDQEFLKVAFSLLPAFPWGGDTWNQWTQKVKEVTGRNGRELYLPLRMRLTGRKNGPEMQHLMPLFQKPIIEIT